MEYLRGHKVLSKKETGLGGEWYLIKGEENFFAYGTLSEIQSLFFVPVNQCGTKEEVRNHCISIIELCEKHIGEYEKKIIKDTKNSNGWNTLINLEKKQLEALTDFAKKLS